MQFRRSTRWLLLALLVFVFTVSSHAQISISVGIAPPPLPVYEQPPCPEPGLMWTPGYWAFDQDQASYYWIPGAWVPAPSPGLLWTPGYWGWEHGRFFFHQGYWGRHVGYYGGVNYGFGYGGIGFAGGEWRGDRFHYNTSIMHVDRRFIHETFEDRDRVERGFTERDNHIAFSGGPGGIRHDPRPEERFAEHEQHMDRSPFQFSHEQRAHADRDSFFNRNGGHPAHPFADRPLGSESRPMPMNDRDRPAHDDDRGRPGHDNWNEPGHARPDHESRPAPSPDWNRSSHDDRITPSRQQPPAQQAPNSRPAPYSQPDAGRNNPGHGGGAPPAQSRPAQPSQPAPASHPAPAAHPAPPASHPAPASKPAPKDEHKH